MQTQTLRNFAGLPCISEERRAKLQELCSNLGITMQQYELLNLALTHTSFAHETHHYPHNEHNERLEFLGDSVLGLIVSTYMYEHFPHFDEGRMTKLRAQVVCEASLYQCAKRIGLGDYLRMGNGELSSGGNKRPSILADAFEAVLGAYYLDQGFAAAQHDRKRGVVAVALHLAAHGVEEAPLRVRRIRETPRGVRLLVHHEA